MSIALLIRKIYLRRCYGVGFGSIYDWFYLSLTVRTADEKPSAEYHDTAKEPREHQEEKPAPEERVNTNPWKVNTNNTASNAGSVFQDIQNSTQSIAAQNNTNAANSATNAGANSSTSSNGNSANNSSASIGAAKSKSESEWIDEEARHRQLKAAQAKQKMEEKENIEVRFAIDWLHE